jgi:hypothetical protein
VTDTKEKLEQAKVVTMLKQMWPVNCHVQLVERSGCDTGAPGYILHKLEEAERQLVRVGEEWRSLKTVPGGMGKRRSCRRCS